MIQLLDVNITSDANAPSRARMLVGRFTRDRVPRAMRENAELLVSELASNAVIHGPAPANDALRLRLALRDECLHVDVTDSGAGFTAPENPKPSAKGGYGLYLLDCAASRWGVARGGRCRVWFELDLREAWRGGRRQLPESSWDSA